MMINIHENCLPDRIFDYKRATLEDIDELVRTRIIVLRAANKLSDEADMTKVEQESYAYYKWALETGEHIAYLVYDNDTFIGAGGVSFYQVMPTFHNPTGKKAYIMNMYTAPEYRRQKIAFHTLDLLVKAAKEHGVSQISLEATEMGRTLYEKYGFVKMEHEMEMPCVSSLRLDMGYAPDAEIWDLYDENRNLLGKDHVRGGQLPIDAYHLVVHVWIRNSKGEYLISQRSANRPTFPLMWECVDGSVIKGEDSLQGALRESKEELGIDLLPENGQVILSLIKKIEFGKVVNKIVDVWLFEYDGEAYLGNATTDEVAQAVWMSAEQIKQLFEQKMFMDTLEYFFAEVLIKN